MKNLFFTTLLLFGSFQLSFGQNGVGIGTMNPDSSAALDIQSNDKGLLIPRMTMAERDSIASPAFGLMVVDINDNSLYFFNGSDWVALNSIDGLLDGKTTANENSLYLGSLSGFNSDSSAMYNIALGNQSLKANRNGDYNVALGYHALHSGDSTLNNVAIGAYALTGNVNSRGNVAIGRSSMFHNSSGSENVSIASLLHVVLM